MIATVSPRTVQEVPTQDHVKLEKLPLEEWVYKRHYVNLQRTARSAILAEGASRNYRPTGVNAHLERVFGRFIEL